MIRRVPDRCLKCQNWGMLADIRTETDCSLKSLIFNEYVLLSNLFTPPALARSSGTPKPTVKGSMPALFASRAGCLALGGVVRNGKRRLRIGQHGVDVRQEFVEFGVICSEGAGCDYVDVYYVVLCYKMGGRGGKKCT